MIVTFVNIFTTFIKFCQIMSLIYLQKQGRIMDVARIEAISPKQIDWRKLTAKEIIKYESTGVEVPSEYLQWARAFRADLQANDTDEVTYENALDTSTSSYVNNSANTDIDGNGSELEKPTQNEDEEPLTANQKYKQMRENGDSLYKIGKIFRDDCNTKAGASEDSSSTLGVIDATSNNEIEALESYMSDFLSKATDIKTQIASLKNKKTDTDFAKINRLQDELKNLGISGQGVVAQYGGDMNGFKSVIDSQVDIGPDAKDYGVESIDIAKKLMGYFWYYPLAHRLEKSANIAIDKGDMAIQAYKDSLDGNSEKLDKISSYQSDISNQTGVAASVGKNEDSETNSKDSNNKKQESEKTVQTAQNDGTDTTAKATTNLDEILKAKIRRGENVDNA